MTPPTRARSSTAPWIVAGVLVLVVAFLVFGLVNDHNRNSGADAGYQLSSDVHAAVVAADTEATNLLTYSRKTFQADMQRALDGATGGVRSDLKSKESQLLTALNKTKLDARGDVLTSAYAGTDGKKILVLVTLDDYRVDATGKAASSKTIQRFELSMVNQKGHWLAANLTSVGIS